MVGLTNGVAAETVSTPTAVRPRLWRAQRTAVSCNEASVSLISQPVPNSV